MIDDQQTAQPKDPIDEFIALPQEQQLSTLQSLAPGRQDALLAKVKERKSAPVAAQPGFFKGIQNSFDANTTTSPTEPLLQTGLKRVVKAVGSPFVHPLDILEGMANMIPASPDLPYNVSPIRDVNPIVARGKEAVSDYKEGGLPYAATKLAGDAVGTVAGGKALEASGAATAAIPKIARGGFDILAKSGPDVASKAVDANIEVNKAPIAKAAKANVDNATKFADDTAAQAAKRTADLQKHFERTSAAKEANDATAGQQSRKVALQRGVETLDPELKQSLGDTEARVRGEANRRYNELNGALDPEVAPAELLPEILSDASETMKGSNTETPIMKDMERRARLENFNGEPTAPLTYRDLQGYRSEIGRELQRGNLPGDVYTAYKGMQEKITNAMEEIAKSKGLGDNFADARSYYRQYADDFLDPKSPMRKALDNPEKGGVVKAFTGKDQSGIEALAKHDPELAARINSVRNSATEAKGIRTSTAAPKPTPTLSPKPTPIPPPPTVEPELTKLGPEDITMAKRTAIANRAIDLHKRSPLGHMASGFAGVDAVRSLMQGNIEHALLDVGARAALSAPKAIAARLLESPRVQQWLSKPTAADLEVLNRLPPEQRAIDAKQLGPLIEAARAKGITIHPAILGLAGTASANGLPSRHPLIPPVGQPVPFVIIHSQDKTYKIPADKVEEFKHNHTSWWTDGPLAQ